MGRGARLNRPACWLMIVLAIVCIVSCVAAAEDDTVPPVLSPPASPSTPNGDEPTSPFPGIPGIPDDPDTVDRNCRLLGPFALFTQAFMGVVVVGSLVLKRQRERPKRPWKVWLLDISKQMLGQLFVHTLNVVLSSLGSNFNVGGEDNPCSLYFLNIAIDTTIGVLFIYYSMRYLTHYFTDVLGLPGFVSGQYNSLPASLERRRGGQSEDQDAADGESANGAPQLRPSFDQQPSTMSIGSAIRKANKRPKVSFFFRQLALYLLSLFIMKVLVLALFAVFPILFDIGHWVLDLFGERKKAQILFVMAIFPLAMNTLQFWLIDSVLRHNPNTSRYRSEEDGEVLPTSVGTNGYSDDMEGQNHTQEPRDGGDEAGGTWTANWWNDMFRGSQDEGHRGSYHKVQRHSIGEASTDNDEAEEEEGHTYPPVASQSSSTAQLDAAEASRAEASKESSSTTTTAAFDAKTSVEANRLNILPTGEDEMQEAWDAWSDEGDDNGGETKAHT